MKHPLSWDGQQPDGLKIVVSGINQLIWQAYGRVGRFGQLFALTFYIATGKQLEAIIDTAAYNLRVFQVVRVSKR
jgi:hypothetical protein